MSEVDHPKHYGGDQPYECIKVLEAWLGVESLAAFCRGNAIKYLSRASNKGSQIVDLQKAAWYIQYEIWLLSGKPEESFSAWREKVKA